MIQDKTRRLYNLDSKTFNYAPIIYVYPTPATTTTTTTGCIYGIWYTYPNLEFRTRTVSLGFIVSLTVGVRCQVPIPVRRFSDLKYEYVLVSFNVHGAQINLSRLAFFFLLFPLGFFPPAHVRQASGLRFSERKQTSSVHVPPPVRIELNIER